MRLKLQEKREWKNKEVTENYETSVGSQEKKIESL